MNNKLFLTVITAVQSVILLGCVIATSLVTVDSNTTGHFIRIWGGQTLQSDEIIARTPMSIWSGTKGPQSEVVLPGKHFMFLQNVLYERAPKEMENVLSVPPGKFAVLVAKDGKPMTGERMLADDWAEQDFDNMLLDATFFLNNGGMKGVQYTVVPSGDWHINNFLWTVADFVDETKVTTGEVAVIRSNIQLDVDQDCKPVDTSTKVPLVPTGCRGVWAEEMGQGSYRFNPRAVTATVISVRQNTNDHTGGYVRKVISFSTDKEGIVFPAVTNEPVPVPDGNISDAIDIRAEGWNVDQDVNTFWQIQDAPRAVADLGDQHAIAQFVARVTQSEFRIIAQGNDIGSCIEPVKVPSSGDQVIEQANKAAYKQDVLNYTECVANSRKAMDLVYKRGEIEEAAKKAISEQLKRYGVQMNKVTMGRPNIPPELLTPMLRTQYAQQMRRTLTEEEQTATKRISVQKANELANNQEILVKADLANQASMQQAEMIEQLAEARKNAALKEAEGQRELLTVMGADRVQEQILVQKVLDMVAGCPECVKVPEVVVTGGGDNDGVTSSAALGAILSYGNVKASLPKPQQ